MTVQADPETLQRERDRALEARDAALEEVARLRAMIEAGPSGTRQLLAQQEAEQAHRANPKRTLRIGEHYANLLQQCGISGGRMLEIGGRKNPLKDFFPEFEIVNLDIEQTGPGVVQGDITHCPQLQSEKL